MSTSQQVTPGIDNLRELTDLLDDTVAQQGLPFAVAAVSDRTGVRWSHAAGMATPEATASAETVMRIFSMSKAVGSVAAHLLVDRGLVTLDEPLAPVLPDLGAVQVLDTFDASGPVLRAPRRPVTLRHLLTNTAGFAYEGWSAEQHLYVALTGAPHPNTGVRVAINGPLMFDPGEGMVYGYGFDWIGPLIEALDGRSAVRFCQDEVFDPIGMPDTMFEPDRAVDRVAQTQLRAPDGSFTPFDVSPPPSPELYGLGQALYGTAADYIRFLRFILNDGVTDDGRALLSPSAMQLLKTPQAGGLTMPAMRSVAPLVSADVNLVHGCDTTWTAGFLINLTQAAGMRNAGSLTWGGFLNTHYWVDHTAGVAAVFMTQLLPFADPEFMRVYRQFERTVYAHTSPR